MIHINPFTVSELYCTSISHTYPVRIQIYLGTMELQTLLKIPEQYAINHLTSCLYYQRPKCQSLLRPAYYTPLRYYSTIDPKDSSRDEAFRSCH